MFLKSFKCNIPEQKTDYLGKQKLGFLCKKCYNFGFQIECFILINKNEKIINFRRYPLTKKYTYLFIIIICRWMK